MKTKTPAPDTTVTNIEAYLQKYIAFSEPAYVLPLALWTMGTFCYTEFDAFPYLVITSATKRSGKTMLSEQLAFCCSNPRQFAAMTAQTMFRCIQDEAPTVFFDEAESLSSESASMMRSVLNVGYRKGQTIPRVSGKGVQEFPTYCPKVFVLIGDVYDTLRDRSIIITMHRMDAPARRLYSVAQEEGIALREATDTAVKDRAADVLEMYQTSGIALPFLTGRDEEIWLPLFCLAKVFCPDRIEELSRCAVDIATEKTAEFKRYSVLEKDKDIDDEYAKRLLLDLYTVFLTGGRVLSSREAVDALKAIPVAPWRKFRGKGLSIHNLADLLSRFGVKSCRIAKGSGRGNQTFLRGYKKDDVESAVRKVK